MTPPSARTLTSIAALAAALAVNACMLTAPAEAAPASAEDIYAVATRYDEAVAQYAAAHHQHRPSSLAAVLAGAHALPAGWRVQHGGVGPDGYLRTPAVTLTSPHSSSASTQMGVYLAAHTGHVSAIALRTHGRTAPSDANERTSAILARERRGLGYGMTGLRAAASELAYSFPGYSLTGVRDANHDGRVDGDVQVLQGQARRGSITFPDHTSEDAALDLGNLATDEETLRTDTNSYGTIASMQTNREIVEATRGVTLHVTAYNGTQGYCLTASYRAGSGSAGESTHTRFYDSQAGGLQPMSATRCPVSTGTAGDSLEGHIPPSGEASDTFRWETHPSA